MTQHQKTPQCIRVVVVDDHQIVREGLRMMLEILGEGFALVGEAADGSSALHLVEATQPDVVLMDLRMPGMDGLEAVALIHSQWPQIAIVVLTTYNEDALMLRSLRAGACSYLLKDTGSEILFQTIRSAARGDISIQPGIISRILDNTNTTLSRTASKDSSNTIGLTEREHEVLEGVARGERSKEIAARLGISLRTVGAHLTSIYTKLNVDSRASAVAVAMERGILSRQ